MEKFPDHVDVAPLANGIRSPSPLKSPSAFTNGAAALPDPRQLAARRENGAPGGLWAPAPAHPVHGHRHGRQRSLGDAFRHIRDRNGSVSEHAQEIADALRAPVSPKLIALCVMWYTSSALTNTSSKSILNALDMPATLTLIQFAIVSSMCFFFAWLASVYPVLRTRVNALKHPIRYPTRDVIVTTLPLAAFQIGGHLLSSTATAQIPVSLVHTIKGLSPLFTVVAYRFVYDIRYPRATYFSLVPLTLGVMFACSGKSGIGGHVVGVVEALLATLIFVTQNIFSKKLFNEAAKSEAEGGSKKLDKLNLLCYSSGLAFLITLPIWFWSEGVTLLGDIWHDGSLDLNSRPGSMDHGRLFVEFLFNGTFHFAQNILAFILLSMVSPVTYSVASLIKRVFVIVIAIIWFRSPTTPVQAFGIGLTFFGLYLYDRTNESNKADKKARTMAEPANGAPVLPFTMQQTHPVRIPLASPVSPMSNPHPYHEGVFGMPPPGEDSKKTDENGFSRNGGNVTWLAPGTKQEETWRAGDSAVGVA